MGNTRTTHGHSGAIQSGAYGSWKSMRQRCNNPNSFGYKYYGGRGIRICKEWDDFAVFLSDMGPRPDGMTLDRKNNDGEYSAENCKWSTQKEQCKNRRGFWLDWDLVNEIRGRHEHGESTMSISKRMSVPRSAIWDVIVNRTWKE